jgi:hypothetical protein
MTKKVFSLNTLAGVQRDGTVFDKNFYTSAKWTRFQRGRPRKILGYRTLSEQLSGPSRGIWVNSSNGLNQVFSGYSAGLQELTIDSLGNGQGIQNFTLSNFEASANNLWQFDGFYDVSGNGVGSILAHPGQNLSAIDSTTDTPVLIGDINGTTMSKIGVFQNTTSYLNSTAEVTIPIANILIGAGQTVSGTGINLGTKVQSVGIANVTLNSVAVTGTSGQCSCSTTSGLYVGQTVTVSGSNTGSATGLASGTTYYIVATNYISTFQLSATSGGSPITTTAGTTTGLFFTIGNYQKVTLSSTAAAVGLATLTFDNKVEVSGGVVALHPFVFVYGNNGLIRNCSASNPANWVGIDSNEVNVASGKIVQALPVRGGTNAPSGLFWSLDSLIRVSYLGGQGTPAQYWKYDIISSQSSILSSQSAIEYDGVYYWCGADRFLLYAGSVKEIPNNYNQNYFFDNLNYSQRQKVWACKVPRYGEIWWFYPRGDATECTDAVIYNVRENVWYDAGEALGARRSAGYFSLVFQYPIMADTTVTPSAQVFVKEYIATSGSVWLYSDTASTQVAALQVISGSTVATGTTVVTDVSNSIKTIGTITGGSGYNNGTYNATALSGGSGFGGTANIIVSGGAVTSVTIVSRGASYVVGGSLTAVLPGGAGFSVLIATVYTQGIQMSAAATSSATAELTFSTPPNRIKIYQHEYGTNQVTNQSVSAIESYFETNDLGWVSGGPAAPSNPSGQGGSASDNRWIRLERVEPDFVQTGDMSLIVTGRPYAQSEDVESAPYVFSPTTGKIDMKEQRRELRLRFVSNTLNGNYQAGKILLDADIGDVRGY